MNNFKNESNKAKDIMHDASKKLDSANNQLQGKMNQVKGDIKMDIGKLTDNPKLQAKGLVDKASGIAQETKGKIQQSVAEAKHNLKK
ncbi:MAG: CsbD family protein [Erysipelotrichaceae bacterium]|jgi:uncharacterized protein YjbJ (UPF0337 family)